ncbi:MAG: HAMP domain-containing sensor histidine kinase [Xenococcaceae cyanobacterium MO_207.B15]|nr:HAMP domain-containing sensor histidine kinase [Xenococcaceae cyanobacterium MO_207.B15]
MTIPEDTNDQIESYKAKISELTWKLQNLNKELEEAKKSNQQLEQLAFLGKNLAYFSHEIGSPVGSIKLANIVSLSYLEKLSKSESDTIQKSSLISLLDNSRLIKDYMERVDNVMNFLNSHIRGNFSSLQDCNLVEVINQSLDMTLYSVAIENDWRVPVEVETDYDSDTITTEIYVLDFEIAICNLIKNSLYSLKQKQIQIDDFCPELFVSIKQLDKEIQIIIEDNGEGIRPQDEDRIFEEFYTTKESEGTGIGLFLVKQIIEENHNGKLTLSTSWGQFTRFTISLPCSC